MKSNLNNLVISILLLTFLYSCSPKTYTYYFNKCEELKKESEELKESNILKSDKKLTQAYNIYSKGILEFPNEHKFYYLRGKLSIDLDSLERAENDFSEAISISPATGFYFYYRGNIRFELSNKKGACEDWNRAAELGETSTYSKIRMYCR